jgi:uncharacterized protein (DUF1697 family)
MLGAVAPTRTRSSGVRVALLRGINVGGKNRLPMEALRELFRDAGAEQVSTYIQSGNVLFRASATLARRLPELVSAAIEERFGYRVAVVLRSAAELRAVPARNPFRGPRVRPEHLHVVFLAARPAAARVANLDPARSKTDRFAVDGREIFLHCPGGLARTKLGIDWFDRRLGTSGTVRNWKTTAALIERLDSVPGS